jgi:hypothetical protein
MTEIPIMPDWVIAQINPKEPKPLIRTTKLFESNGQYSMHFPKDIIYAIGWEAGNKIKMTTDSDKIVLSR